MPQVTRMEQFQHVKISRQAVREWLTLEYGSHIKTQLEIDAFLYDTMGGREDCSLEDWLESLFGVYADQRQKLLDAGKL